MMKLKLLFGLFLQIFILSSILNAQSTCPKFEDRFETEFNYSHCIEQHRKNYISDFLIESHSPIHTSDTTFFDFFSADSNWWLDATYVLTPNAIEFQIATSSGKTKPYKQFALLHFEYKNVQFELAIYQSLGLIQNPEYKDYLFLPFMDRSNGETTYEGGRYIDLKMGDLKENGHVYIDFNRAYNPYCAFSGGYSCPVPPKENHLKLNIEAGEKKFKKPH